MVSKAWPALVALVLVVACGSSSGSAPATPTQRAAANATRTASGPSLSIEPSSGPPGTLVTVTGAGWPARASVSITAAAAGGAPYAMATTGDDGVFTARFRLERAPDGSDLKTGRFDLRAIAASSQATAPFQVDPPRPVRDPSSGG